ncbi:MAG: DUF1838 family protein [Steroidobacteraceae bacterium]
MNSQLVSDLMIDRRALLKGAIALGASAAAPMAQAKTVRRSIDYTDPADNLYAFGKIWAGYDEPVIGCFHGLMYARFGDQRMIPVFGFAGTGVLLARQDGNGDLWLKSRETAYFTDLRTGDVLEHWYNPFTERTVEVYHFYNGALIGRIGKEIPRFFVGGDSDSPTLMNEGTAFPDAQGNFPFLLPFQFFGDDALLSWDYTHEYSNPVTVEGWPRSSTGPRVSPSEHFTFAVSRQALEDRDLPTVRSIAGFSRISQFWPFMEMGGTKFANGALFGRMFSHKGLNGFGDVQPKVLAYVEKHAPEMLEIPAGWEPQRDRLETWKAYAADVPPENPDYDWQPSSFRVPTGRGARSKPLP